MYLIVLAGLAVATAAVVWAGVWLRRSTEQITTSHEADLASVAASYETALAALQRALVEQRERHAAQLRETAVAAREAAEASFRRGAGQALGLFGKDKEPEDPSPTTDPTTMPKQHPADCRCGKCRTKLSAAPCPRVECNCGRRGCTGCQAVTLGNELGVWANLSTDPQFALVHDLLLDRPAPASLRERTSW